MGEEPGTARASVAADNKDPEQIRADIEATRQELGDTVEALAAKADVKAHARERIERTKASLPSQPIVLGGVAVVVVGLVAWRLTRR
jgi:type VI protein secretion system component VasF